MIVLLFLSGGTLRRHVYPTITSIEPTLPSYNGRSLSSDKRHVTMTNHEWRDTAAWQIDHWRMYRFANACIVLYTFRVKRPWTDGGNICEVVARLAMRRRPDISARASVVERRRYSNSRWFHGRFNVSSIYFSQGCSVVNYVACALGT